MLLRLFRELLQLLPGAVATTFAPIFGVGGVGGQKLERTLGALTCECAELIPTAASWLASGAQILRWRLH